MCVSCVRKNMILNDHYVRPTTTDTEETSTSLPLNGQINDNSEVSATTPATPIIRTESVFDTELVFENDLRKRSPIFTAQDKHYLMTPAPARVPDFDVTDISNLKVKRSFSFGGYGLFSPTPAFVGLTSQEIESMIDPVSKKEPSKSSKKQIKDYAKKYGHLENDTSLKHPWYRDLVEYTQPAHLVTCIAIVYLGFRLFPDSRRGATEASTLTRLLYVSSVSAVFGAQFWMTFISGVALFFAVPRHMFAKVQSVLFPLYFLTVAALMLVAVITYAQHNPTHLWDNHQLIQGAILVFGFFVNLGIRLYLAPILTKLITIKVAIEAETGLGKETGSNQPGVLSRCPHYMRFYKAFRKLHLIIAIGNMISMAGTSLHLYYLATKLCASSL